MANLVRARGWGQVKPLPGSQIDWGHPLAQGLRLCVLFNEGAGRPFDLARQRSMAPGANGSGAITPSFWGTGLRTAGATTNSGYTHPDSLWVPTTAITAVVAKHRFDTTARNSATFGSGGTVLNAFLPFSGTYYWRWGATDLTYTPGAVPTNPIIWTMTGGPRGRAMYQNTALVASNGTAATSATSSNPWYLGSDGSGGSLDDNCTIGFAYIWDRQFSLGEVEWLNAEPYAFVAPPGPKILYIDLGKAGGATFSTGGALAGNGVLAGSGTRIASTSGMIAGHGSLSGSGSVATTGGSFRQYRTFRPDEPARAPDDEEALALIFALL